VKPLLLALAWISFALGIIGAFLPILPTTPFLLLAAFLFSKSSPRLHNWLLSLPVAGEGMRDWNNNRVIKPRAKILCVSMIMGTLVVMFYNAGIPLILKICISSILVGVGIFVICQKSRPSGPQSRESLQSKQGCDTDLE
jgi:uncharacterized membrane protein YbaN (DUF454 family)